MAASVFLFAALSALEVLNVQTQERQVVQTAPDRMQSPHFSPDGQWLYFNENGRLFRLHPTAGSTPEAVNTGGLVQCNNDHGLSPDGSLLVIGDQLGQGAARIYVMPTSGGAPRRIDIAPPAYWHGFSPDGATLVYAAARAGNDDIYTIPVAGGPERRLTTDPSNDNGPEFSADSRWIYFFSDRGGGVRIWRMRADGSDQRPFIADGNFNWFPHPSPDGQWIAYLSSRIHPTTGHPPDGECEIRLVRPDGSGTKTIARFYGGNGSFNVPCWSRDSHAIAFASFADPTAGKVLFQQQCAACHALASDGIGPRLGGVTLVRSHADLLAWILDPQRQVAQADDRTRALLGRYKVVMPGFAALSAGQVDSILAYIEAESYDQHLTPAKVEPAATAPRAWVPAIRKSNVVVEVQDVAQIPRLPGRTPYMGITLVRPDPRSPSGLLVLDLMGVIYRVDRGQVAPFLDIRGDFPEFVWQPGVASGLGSFALDPNFADNGVLYTTHSERFRHSPIINPSDIPGDLPPGPTPPLEWVLTEWHTREGTHREVLRFATPTTAHAAQELAFAPVPKGDPDYGLLYLGVGDGGSVNLKRPDLAGHPHSLFGTILRIDPHGQNGANGRYGIPADNPFAYIADPRVHREIWAYGFRNPHRMSWDLPYGKRMIAVNIGESNIESVDLIQRGGSYGWGKRLLEGPLHIDAGTDAKPVRRATPDELEGIVAPFANYDHREGSAAITGGYVYHGPIAALRDKYLFGDIVSGRLFYVKMGPALEDHAIYELAVSHQGAPTTLKELGHLDRAHLRIGYDPRDGTIYLTTKGDGMIRKIVSAREFSSPAPSGP